MDDWQLITEYVSTGAEGAFRSLVERHLGLVHSVAMREVRDPELAREVSQAVFILLARKARSFRRSVVLSAWLFRTTRFVALRAVRSEYRRQRREQEAVRMQTFNEPSEAWPRVEPVLDETLAELGETDRGALLLRYYEDQSLREVGTKLGINEEAAKKRVSRALDKLRTAFSRRGLNVSGAILAGVISQNIAEAAPAALANAVASSALAVSSGATRALVQEVLDAWHWARLKVAFSLGLGVVVALFVVRSIEWMIPTTSQSTNAIAVSESNEPTAATALVSIPAKARTARPLLFKVIDAETGAGIPGAELHARYWVRPDIEPRDDLVTDVEGVCAVPLPDQSMGRLDLGILAPGYVQKFFTWWPDRFGPLPRSYTFKLERGVGIGGSVRDEAGQPVANASIILKFPGTGESDSREPKRERLGFWEDLPAVKTDAMGRWQCAHVPPRYSDFSISVKHNDFPDSGFSVQREGDSQIGVLSIDDLYAAKAVLTLRAGLSVTGIVIDERDKPIPAASICVSRWADQKKPAAVTGPDGKFTVRNLKTAGFPLTVMAEGFAPERTHIDPTDAVPLRVQLKPASLLRVRVVDPSGQPVSRADVAIEGWREHGSLELREPTDENGIFEWRSAPPDEVEICVLKNGYATVRDIKVVPNGSEHLVTIKPHFRVIGRVVDGESGMPIPSFKAVPGYGRSGSKWDLGDVAYGQSGQYELNFTEQKPPYSVRILADGFEPAESSALTDEFIPQTQNFELRRANPLHAIKGVVRLPDGRPAADVDVAVCTIEKGVCIAQGRVARNSFAQPIQTDAEGKFEFPPNADAHTIVSVAREGVARVPWNGDGKPLEIRLQPWGRIEGTVRLASGSAGKHILLLDHSFSRYGGGTSLDHQFSATTDAEGRFAIAQAPPGDYDLYVAPTDGTPYSHRTPVTVRAAQTVQAEIGRGGIMIKGRFELDDSEQRIDWSNQIGFITFQTNEEAPQPPGGLDRASIERWKRDFWQSERGRAFLSKEKAIALQVAADGSFTAENVKPGDYELTVNLYDRVGDRRTPNHLKDSHLIACLSRKEISIPESSLDQPLDLGTITLLPRGQQAKR